MMNLGGGTTMDTADADLLLGDTSRFTPELVDHYLQTGGWRQKPLGEYLVDAAATWPDAVAAMTIEPETGDVKDQVTYAEMLDLTRRAAAGLAQLGVRRGDVVAVMTPNRLEFGVLVFAIASLGAVYTGIPVTYGRREATFMVRRSGAKVLVAPASFRGRDLLEFARELRADVPQALQVVVLDGTVPSESGWSAFADLTAVEPHQPAQVPAFSLVQLGFTSGTTSEPKAVMNTHQTLDAVVRNWRAHIGDTILRPGLVNLVVSPVGHSTGFFWGALLTALVGGTAAYLEHWSPEAGAAAIARHGVNLMVGSPTFLLDLLRTEPVRQGRVRSLEMIAVAGAPVPRRLVGPAREQLGCFICPAWGMTEYGIGVSGAPHLPRERVEASDGVAVPGCQVRVVDDDTGTDVPPGTEGDLQITGPGLFAGYYARPDFTREAFVDGWLRTGDRATADADGWVTLMGRTKDIIIRGGENIPVMAVENLLYGHPAVDEVAVIGFPDPRLGERACAVVALQPGGALDMDEMRRFLLEAGLSKRFLPERLIFIDSMPKTASGKIRKIELRERCAASATEVPLMTDG
jgi:cyclohexanecarboxylate-CoA ligase